MNHSILIVDDNRGILSALKLTLSHDFKTITTLPSPTTLVSELSENQYDVVLLDMNFTEDTNTGNEGLFWLSEIKRRFDTEVVLFTAYADIELAVTGIKRGAYDFIVKPWDNEKLIKTLVDAANLTIKKRDKNAETHRSTSQYQNENESVNRMFWGDSAAMQSLRRLVEKAAPSDASVLITGENGTGKDLLAKEIHNLSLRKSMPFVAVDMGSMPETLFESELFGHVRGAFTDAKSDRAGKFEAAGKGTLFLDEIGNIPLHLQAKLLRVLQSRTITRIGDNKVIPVDIRLVCATNMDIEKMVKDGSFREDLYYRINTIKIQLPSLRQRREDIIPLAEIFIQRFANQYNKTLNGISDEAKETLVNCKWGGNIRELQNCIEKAVVLCDSTTLQKSDFQLNYLELWKPEEPAKAEEDATLDEIEKNAILNVMRKYDGNLTLVAKHLNISRQTLYNKLNKYGL